MKAPMASDERLDKVVLRALQGLLIGVTLLAGGVHPRTVVLACPIVFGLLAATIRQRRRRGGGPRAPGLPALAAFVALALLTTVPLPPAALGWLSPRTAQLYAEMLPGWPGGGGWSPWRPLAIDPYGVWMEVLRLSIGLGVFAVIVAYPWQDSPRGDDGRERVTAQLLLTLMGAGLLFSLVAFIGEVAGNGHVLWITDTETSRGRVGGPFVNPDHFAAWLEMTIPAVFGYFFLVLKRVHGRLMRAVHSGRRMGVQAPRAWASALIANQGRLWSPVVAGLAALIMVGAHTATESRGGRAALLAGLAVATAGMLASGGRRKERGLIRRWAPAVVASSLLLVSAGSLVLWALADDEAGTVAIEESDIGLGSRLALAVEGLGIVVDHPLLGTGLGSWLHAFRPYQAPPVEGGIWDHAHNDYLELTAESGVAGVALVLLFGLSIIPAMRRRRAARGPAGPPEAMDERMPGGFEQPDWRAELGEQAFLRWGLAGGVVAILVHSLVDFGLRMPANLLMLMVVLALLVLMGRRQRNGRTWALLPMLGLLLLAALPPIANSVLLVAGKPPISPLVCLEASDAKLAEEGAWDEAAALARRAIEWSPANRETHQALAQALGHGPEAEAALRKALALEPWAADVRDDLGIRLWQRGDRRAAAKELEEAMFRFPHLVSHAYLDPESGILPPDTSQQLIRELTDGDIVSVRLSGLDEVMVGAIERGLRRALDTAPGGEMRTAIVDDLVTLLEARERWSEAAATLRTEADLRADESTTLARAARDYLKGQDYEAAEQMLLAALIRTPDQGDLYRKLAVDVYARQGDFPAAESVLAAGERNALDSVPVFRGVTEVLARRDSARTDEIARYATPPVPGDDDEDGEDSP